MEKLIRKKMTLEQTDQTNDQNYKNLIVDYPYQSIQFFAPNEAGHVDERVNIAPLREEQIKERLGERFRELDVPLSLHWPDGRRGTIILMFEEHTDIARFEIDKLAKYCLDITKLMNTKRIVPVVIFPRRGDYPLSLTRGSEYHTYLYFNYIACPLWELEPKAFWDSDNIVARLNLPLMHRKKKKGEEGETEEKLAIYDQSVEGLLSLEKRVEYQYKYMDFIDYYADLSDQEYKQYLREYLSRKDRRNTMGALQRRLQTVSEQSKADGKIEGETELLKRLLTRRFGPLPTWALDRLQQASTEQLEVWAERIFDIDSPESFFD